MENSNNLKELVGKTEYSNVNKIISIFIKWLSANPFASATESTTPTLSSSSSGQDHHRRDPARTFYFSVSKRNSNFPAAHDAKALECLRTNGHDLIRIAEIVDFGRYDGVDIGPERIYFIRSDLEGLLLLADDGVCDVVAIERLCKAHHRRQSFKLGEDYSCRSTKILSRSLEAKANHPTEEFDFLNAACLYFNGRVVSSKIDIRFFKELHGNDDEVRGFADTLNQYTK